MMPTICFVWKTGGEWSRSKSTRFWVRLLTSNVLEQRTVVILKFLNLIAYSHPRHIGQQSYTQALYIIRVWCALYSSAPITTLRVWNAFHSRLKLSYPVAGAVPTTEHGVFSHCTCMGRSFGTVGMVLEYLNRKSLIGRNGQLVHLGSPATACAWKANSSSSSIMDWAIKSVTICSSRSWIVSIFLMFYLFGWSYEWIKIYNSDPAKAVTQIVMQLRFPWSNVSVGTVRLRFGHAICLLALTSDVNSKAFNCGLYDEHHGPTVIYSFGYAGIWE